MIFPRGRRGWDGRFNNNKSTSPGHHGVDPGLFETVVPVVAYGKDRRRASSRHISDDQCIGASIS